MVIMGRNTQSDGCPRRAESGRSGVDVWTKREGLRRCSYCGSIHPDDFMRIARDGSAEIGPTDKSYKVYVEGMGSFAKFYLQHLSREQRDEFIELYNTRSVRVYGEGFEFTIAHTGTSAMAIGYPGHFYVPPFFTSFK